MEVLQAKLAEFAEVCEADEVVLFGETHGQQCARTASQAESWPGVVRTGVTRIDALPPDAERATFLVIASCTLKAHADLHRFEKIANIVKQFKLSCM